MGERLIQIGKFILGLVARAEARLESGQAMAPLMMRLLEIEDPEIRFSNFAALLVAGHDTTAYTMQFVLFELARHPRHQARARQEAAAILADVRAQGRELSFEDLPRFTFLTKCIAETLRLWNVAMITFGRVTSYADEVSCDAGTNLRCTVSIPAGTPFTFWFFGHHHSPATWGSDAAQFNPERTFDPHEVMCGRGHPEPPHIARTPCTERFHPFSVPARDCLGKNFAFLEMRVVLSQILCSFELSLPDTPQQHVTTSEKNAVFTEWASKGGATVQPESLWIDLKPIKTPMHGNEYPAKL